jgi:hypothetical protein
MNKAGALVVLSSSFKFVPDNAQLEEEISIIENVKENLKKKPIKEDFSTIQETFRNNRFSEIVKENSNIDYFKNTKNSTIDEKILKAETMGLLFTSMTDKKVSTGHTIGELVSDLYRLYIKEYKLFRQNPQHPLFTEAIFSNSDLNNQIIPETIKNNNSNGCLSVLLIIIFLSSLIFLK